MPATVFQAAEQSERLAFTINEFAKAYRISRRTLYNLWRDGAGPAKMRVRGRVLISRAAGEKWRREVEGSQS